MKKCTAAFFALLMVAFRASAGDAFIVEIIRPAPLQKEALFNQTVLWMAESFQSSKETIELKDKELGTIIGNASTNVDIGLSSFLPSVLVPVTFKLRIDVKDSKYRMTFSNVKMDFDESGVFPIEKTKRNSTEPKVRARFELITNSLDAYLATPRTDF